MILFQFSYKLLSHLNSIYFKQHGFAMFDGHGRYMKDTCRMSFRKISSVSFFLKNV